MLKITPGQFEYVVSQTQQGVLGQLLTVVMVTPLLLRIGFPEPNLYLWDACVVLLLAYRYLGYRLMRRDRDVSAAHAGKAARIRYAASLFMLGVLWAVLFAKIMQQPSIEAHLMAMVLGMGLAGAAIATLGAAFPVYFAFVAPMLLTLVVTFLAHGTQTHVTAAMFLAIGVVFSLYTAYKYSLHFELMQQAIEQLKETEIEALVCLGKAGEYRDSETGDHVLRVGYASYLLAKAAGFNETDAKNLMYASPLHDLGKIGIPDQILLKPAKLTDVELQFMQKHTWIGAEILKNSKTRVMTMARTVALSHHEKWDGSGYPLGIAGKDIPLEGRIVAICDVFDALISNRPYKDRWTDTEAIAHLRQNAGTHFDPALVALFIDEIPKIKEFILRLDEHESATGLHPLVQLT